MTETILFPLFIVLVAIAVTSTVALVVNSINSTHNYTYKLLGTFIQNYNYIWDREDSGYRTNMVAIFEDKENKSRKYEGSLVQANKWLRSWERYDITTEQLVEFLKEYGVEFRKVKA